MKVTETELPGLKVVHLNVHGDARGFFVERYNAEAFAAAGLPTHFVQDNHSRSAPGVLRGLHYQFDPPQAKLVGTLRGRIWDVAVDLREGSPTFGRHFDIELSDVNGLLLWVPAGFAHGFYVLGEPGGEPTDVFYKVDATYNPRGERGIRWDDPDLAIDWPLAGGKAPELSARDRALSTFAAYRKTPSFR